MEGAGLLGKLSRATGIGRAYSPQALRNKVGEVDDPRLEADEYQMLGQFSQDARYAGLGGLGGGALGPLGELQRRNRLIDLAQNPEIEEILDTLTDELITNDPDAKYFASPVISGEHLDGVSPEVVKAMQRIVDSEYPRLYRMLNFGGNGAWELMRNWLIWGKVAFEVVYDDLENPKKIIGMLPIDPLTLAEYWEEGVRYWIQEPRGAAAGIGGGAQRLFHDSQIVMIAWDTDYGRISYAERLLRPFNIYRVMERTKVNWHITNSQFRTLITIPTAGKGRTRGAKTLSSAMARYKDDITFDDATGAVEVNGTATIPANKEYWMVDGDSGTPKVDVVSGDGPDMSDTSPLTYFERRLQRISKLPLELLDPSSSETWNIDPTSQRRQEIKFSNFVDRVRNKFAHIIMNPLLMQLVLDIPAVRGDMAILDSVRLSFVKNNIFNELAQMEIMSKRVEFVEKMSQSLISTDAAGRTRSFFPHKWLASEYLKLTSAQISAIEAINAREDAEAAQGGLVSTVDAEL